MANNYNSLQPVPAPLKIFVFIGVILKIVGFYILAQVVTAAVFKLVAGQEFDSTIFDTDPDLLRKSYLIAQFAGFTLCFVILPWLYLTFLKPDVKALLALPTKHLPEYLAIVLLLFFASIPLMSWVIDWNKAMQLPAQYSELQKLMEAVEESMEKLIKLIAVYDSFPSLIVGLVVIALLPAVGEELVFRGIMQNEFYQVSRNPHVAIWVSAFFFSFIHFQFFGFVPRMLLGALLGYLYYWSGSIYTSMFLHFINNAISLLAMNFQQKKIINFDPEAADNFPTSVVIVSVGLSVFFLFFYYKLSRKEKEAV